MFVNSDVTGFGQNISPTADTIIHNILLIADDNLQNASFRPLLFESLLFIFCPPLAHNLLFEFETKWVKWLVHSVP